jgi:hypothetical protein
MVLLLVIFPRQFRLLEGMVNIISDKLMLKGTWMILIVQQSVQLEHLDMFMHSQQGVKNQLMVIFSLFGVDQSHIGGA